MNLCEAILWPEPAEGQVGVVREPEAGREDQHQQRPPDVPALRLQGGSL